MQELKKHIKRINTLTALEEELINNIIDFVEEEIEFEPRKIRVLQQILCSTSLNIAKVDITNIYNG